MLTDPEQFVGFKTQRGTRRAVFGAVLQVALSFLGKRAAPMPSEGKVIAKELFKHGGFPSIGACRPPNQDESYVAGMLPVPGTVTAFK
jgi:hypothetical protein